MSGVPPSLKGIQPFLKLSDMFMKKDRIVAYYCKLYAIQEGIAASKNDAAGKAFLMTQMDQISQLKKALKEDDASKDDVVAQAHIEEFAFKLFETADNEDRAGRFHNNMIKAFYTSNLVFTILKQFGPLSDEVQTRLKYAKWKAVEIDRCLKNGITPTPGPPGGDEGGAFNLGDLDADLGGGGGGGGGSFDVPPPQSGPSPSYPTFPPAPSLPAPTPSPDSQRPVAKPRHLADPGQPPPPQAAAAPRPTPAPAPQAQAKISSVDVSRAQKLCKFASSALDYEDVAGAVDFLQKAINLLKTGKEE
eukprot:Em0023g372a